MLPGGPGTAAPVETDRGKLPRDGGGTPSPENAGLDEREGGMSLEEDGGRLPEATEIGGPGGPGGGGGGMLLELAARLGGAEPRGGGGVARTGSALLGSFLFTHFFKSLS